MDIDLGVRKGRGEHGGEVEGVGRGGSGCSTRGSTNRHRARGGQHSQARRAWSNPRDNWGSGGWSGDGGWSCGVCVGIERVVGEYETRRS